MNGVSTLFHTDNGKEFKNLDLRIYLENKNITNITSARYHPQSNGCCEALHKEIKKFLLDALYKQKDNFDIEISIADSIEFHNNRELPSTGFKPVDIRHKTDIDIINKVVLNIIRSMQRKINKFNPCAENTLILACRDIEAHGNRFILKNKKDKKI